MTEIFRVTRRDFLEKAGLGAGALVFGCHISVPRPAAGTTKLLRKVFHDGIELNHFVSIKLDGTIVVMIPRPEMGQGIRSSLAAVLADELEADWSRVEIRQADAEAERYAIPNPYPGGEPKYLIPEEGAQFADSSRSMALYFEPMRLFGAGIRLVMERAAALNFSERLGRKVDPSECEARQHEVYLRSTRQKVEYKKLLLEAIQVGTPDPPDVYDALKPSKEWRFIGKEMPFVDARDMVTGKAVYGADVDEPGTRVAMVVRCPVANGKLKSYDATAAMKVPGVEKVIPMDFDGGVGRNFQPHAGVAVVAENTWAAWEGRRALEVEWDPGPNANYDSTAFRRELERSTSRAGKTLRRKGDVDAALATGRTVEADYYVPHLAQAPMEPPVTTARYDAKSGSWEIWASTQAPDLTQRYVGLSMLEPDDEVKWLLWQATEPSEVRECEKETVETFNADLAAHFRVDLPRLFEMRDELKTKVRDKVKVHVPLLGGGFGRKSQPDFAIEAAYLAKKIPGVPIRVQWTREDDIQFSYFHAVSHQHLEASLDADGRARAWLQRSAFPSFFASIFPPPSPGAPAILHEARDAFKGGGEYPYASSIERGQGLEDMPYDIENLRLENCPAESHIRVGWMRSVSNIFHAFAVGSFADELAIAAGRDSKDYLLELIGEGRELDLEAEEVQCFDNNGFPAILPVGKPAILPPYPPDTGRLRGVVERVAEEAGWDAKVRRYRDLPRRGLGIAAHRSFLSYVATVVDVSLGEDDELTIHEIHSVIDCGRVVNPDRVRAQMEGGIVYGLSYALLGEITVEKGAVQQHNFHDYPVLRIHQTPKIHVHLASSEKRPTGAGEPPTPPVAPALVNAIVAAGGPRLRELPIWKALEVS